LMRGLENGVSEWVLSCNVRSWRMYSLLCSVIYMKC
jgi:hypothetical protein